MKKLKKNILLTFLIVLSIHTGGVAFAANPEKCFMCHKYPSLGHIDPSGTKHNYYVDERSYDHSLHRRVSCKECHPKITAIPHDSVREDVNCAGTCHMMAPFSKEKFSHRQIAGNFNNSVHAAVPDEPPELTSARPYCKFCHQNPLYQNTPEQAGAYPGTLERCFNCHLEKGVVQAYRHITHRLGKKTSRSRQEIVALCGKCHSDEGLMRKFKVSQKTLTAVKTYNRTIHGKAVMLGSQKAADCISCHASNVIHDILSKENPAATIHKDRLGETCKQCHSKTNSWFIRIAVHPSTEPDENPTIYAVHFGLKAALYGTLSFLLGLLLLEILARKRDGIKFLLQGGTSWRGDPKRVSFEADVTPSIGIKDD